MLRQPAEALAPASLHSISRRRWSRAQSEVEPQRHLRFLKDYK